MPRHPKKALAFAITALAALLVACGDIANPEGWATPHFTNDTLYYFPDDDTLVAVTFDDDQPQTVTWGFPDTAIDAEANLDIDAVYGDVVVDDDVIYFAGWEGHVYAVDRDSGRLLWTTRDRLDVEGSIVAGLLHHNNTLYFGTTEGFFYALEDETGAPAPGWRADGIEFPKGLWATPLLLDETIYLATMTGEVHAISAEDGSPVWDAPFESGTGAIPELSLLNDELLFVPTLGKTVYLLDAATGQEEFPSFDTEDWVWTSPAFDGNYAYFGDFEGVIHALDITTGHDAWTAQAEDKVKAAPAIVDDVVVFADRGPVVHFFDRETGDRIGVPNHAIDSGTVRADLVARDGYAYILTTSGDLWRADPETATVQPVPMPGAAE